MTSNSIGVGDLVTVKLGNNIVANKAEVLRIPIWENDLWVLKDLSSGQNLQVSAQRATIIKLI